MPSKALQDMKHTPHHHFAIHCSVVILLLLSICVPLKAQQNLFNVPSSDITPSKTLFFQQQINDFSNGFQSNTTFSYGLDNDFELGLNILGLTYDYDQGLLYADSVVPYSPLICINAQKKVEISHAFSVSLGTQIGFHNQHTLSSYVYLNSIYHNPDMHLKLIGGLYYSSDGFFGGEQRGFVSEEPLKNIGMQAGVEYHLINNTLLFQSDLITGKHSMGENVSGLAYFLTPTWILSAGYQLPLFSSTSQKAIVIELTYSPLE